MPKKQGVKGGNLIHIYSEEEYNTLLQYLQDNLDWNTLDWTPKQKYNLKLKSLRFQVVNDGQEPGNWPHGENVLQIKLFPANTTYQDIKNGTLPTGTAIFVPEWKKKELFTSIHSFDHAGHFGRERMHHVVRKN